MESIESILTVQSAYERLMMGDNHLSFVHAQVETSELAMRTIIGLGQKTVDKTGSVTEASLLQAIASAFSIGVKIGLEMSGSVPHILMPGGVIQ